MEDIYDRTGRSIGRLRGNLIYDRAGHRVIGYLTQNYVFSQSRGRHVGYLCSGFFIDMFGFPVGVIAGAIGGPNLPRGVPRQRIGIVPGAEVPSLPHAPLPNWSDHLWLRFMEV